MPHGRKRIRAFDDFRWNNNVIAVRNEEDYDRFYDFLVEFNDELADDFVRRTRSYDELCRIERMNYSDPSCVMFEVKDSGEYGLSITWTGADDYDRNTDYYGAEPIEMSEI